MNEPTRVSRVGLMLDRIHELGSEASAFLARLFGHSLTQLLVVIGCAIWIATGRSVTMLANVMSIGAFVLAQIILNQQRRREMAVQLKLDELVFSQEGARDEVAGAEARSEREIAHLTER